MFRSIYILNFYILIFLGYDDHPESLLRLRAKSWFDPMDGSSIGDHMVTVSMVLNDTQAGFQIEN